MLEIIAQIIGLGSLVFFILVLIKLFQQKGVLHGILGILCGIYTFIWGWMESSRLGIKNIMLIWTALIVVGIVLNVLVMQSASGPATAP